MPTIIKALEQVKQRAEEIRSDRKQRFPEAASVGDYHRQGDLYLTLLAAVPVGAVKVEVERQLAPGTTQGSRHVLNHANVGLYRMPNADVLTGPIVDVARQVTVTHPEHGDVVLPKGVYGITYQRAFTDELRRVMD